MTYARILAGLSIMNQDGFNFLSVLQVLGGLSVFLFGMDLMSSNLKKAAGNTLKLILEKATDHPVIGVFVGTIVTAIIQSSSATTSILVSFVQSQLMTFERTVAVIMGANIGTTVTAQIVAFKITKWSLPIIFLGFLIQVIAKRTKTKNIGYVILGLGLLFFGLQIMSDTMKVLRSSEYFLDLMQSLANPWLGVLVGALFTALVQSSSATLGIMIGMASSGLVSVAAAIPIIFGANLGTCVTAFLAALTASNEAKRVAAAHILFNAIGVLLFVFWIPEFTALMQRFSPTGDVPRLIANAQTSFNIIATFLWFPFINQLVALSKAVVPVDEAEKKKYNLPKVSSLSKSPELLMIQSKHALRYHKNIVKGMLWASRDYFIKQDSSEAAKIMTLREEQQDMRLELLDFLSRLSRTRLDYANASNILNQTALVNEIEHVAYKLAEDLDILEKAAPQFDESYEGLEHYFRKTVKYYSKACNAVLNDSSEDAIRVSVKIDSLREFEDELRHITLEKIYSHNSDSHEADQTILEALQILRSINNTSRRICQIVIDEQLRLAKI